MSEKFDLKKSRMILSGKLNDREPGDMRKVFARAAEGIQQRIAQLELDVIRHHTFRPMDADGVHASKLLREAETELANNRRYHTLAVFFLQAMEWFQCEKELEEAVELWFGSASAHVYAEGGAP